jgi:hypothetical protein
MEKQVRITVSDVSSIIDDISVRSTHSDEAGLAQSKLMQDLGIDSLDFVRLVQGIEMLDKMHGCVVDESVADELYPDITVSKFVEVVNKNIRPHL